ncbi:ribonuclease HIII [Mycoplasma anserisalpingitidis]|uniref:Ribonuclease n=1 Tax=Mycoplasma anserisalpingitidis TaxID=519450 RepID=A0A5B8K518_9MOLU|nr:ribonuclease HIII [Mycoplasma anserisalpingitidis]QDY88085.1 ribonuclease HIII [Mycoplasma anserisalpingitidis]
MKYYDSINNVNLDKDYIIGIDETGVGDYFTPLISCATYVPKENIDKLKKLGVKDSKKISDIQIIKLAPQILSLVKFSVYKLSQNGYNSLTKKYNVNELKFFTHIKATNLLLAKLNIKPDLIIIDKYSTTNSILKYHNEIMINNNWAELEDVDSDVLLITKAEGIHISVAASSIIARYKLLEYMKEQENEWNFAFPLGASEEVKMKVKEFVQIYGEKNLRNVCKLNFKI